MKGFIVIKKQNIALKQTVAVTFLFYGASKCRTVQKERRKFKQIGPCELFVKSQSGDGKDSESSLHAVPSGDVSELSGGASSAEASAGAPSESLC